VITDPKGAALPGATVTLSDPQTGFTRTVNSGGDGAYQFLQILPATYTVTASAKGLAGFKQENVRPHRARRESRTARVWFPEPES